MTKPRARKVPAPQEPQISLPRLRAFGGSPLAPDGDHDGVCFADLDLSGMDAAGSTFLDCRMSRCVLTESRLHNARLIDSELLGVQGGGTTLAGAELRDVLLAEARLGGTQLHGARLTRVHVRGSKLEFGNLRQSVLKDVLFENCLLIEPDFADTRLERVAFHGCTLRQATFDGALLRDVDLRHTAELDIASGIDRLAGAVVNPGQLVDLAPALAAQLGIRVED